MRRKIIKIILSILILAIIILGALCIIDHIRMNNNEPVLFSTWGKKYSAPLNESEGTNVVLTLHDKISEDTAWCGTFQLIWNDLKNEIAKQDIAFNPQLTVVENLNKETFTTKDISEDAYYKVYGIQTPELKEKIEKEIKEKFNETSDILGEFNWKNSGANDYFLYSILKKEFKFEKQFSELENGKFGEYNNVQYFGINDETKKEVKNQVEVLYYKSSENFAIKLLTKQKDEVIIAKGREENTFYDIYQNINEEAEQYTGHKNLGNKDKLKIPNIQFRVQEQFEELENKKFKFANNEEYSIGQAIQTIEFELDKTGGKIKSEAAMNALMSEAPFLDEVREFLVDDSFTIFLREKGKSLPYFAAQIDDISKFQTSNTQLVKDEKTEKSDKIVAMYKAIIDRLMENNSALYSTDKYISLDVESLKAPAKKGQEENLPLKEEERNELIKYCKKYHEEVKTLSIEELIAQGYNTGDDNFISLEGALWRVIKIEKLTENEAVIWFQAFHSGLGAIMPKYELKYKNGKWEATNREMAIS